MLEGILIGLGVVAVLTWVQDRVERFRVFTSPLLGGRRYRREVEARLDRLLSKGE